MNWLTKLLIYVLDLRSAGDLIKVQKIYLLENKFWCVNQGQHIIRNKGYLSKVDIGVECKTGETIDSFYYSKTCFPLKSTNFGYIVLGNLVIKGITSVLKSPGNYNFFLRFRFFFTDKPIDNPRDYRNYDGRIREYVTYKFVEKNSKKENNINNNINNNYNDINNGNNNGNYNSNYNSNNNYINNGNNNYYNSNYNSNYNTNYNDINNGNNNIHLRCDGTGIRMEHIRDMFKGFIWAKLLKFKKYIKNIGKKKLIKKLNGAGFNLYYFESFNECLQNLEEFIKDLCCFKLINNNCTSSLIAKFSKMSIDKTTTLKVSQFKRRLRRKFYMNLKKLYDIETGKTWKILFDHCFYFIKNEILKNNIFLPIGGKYDINYYIFQLSNLIYESVEKNRETSIASDPKNRDFILSRITFSLKIELKNLQIRTIKDLCEFEYVHKHFSELLGSEVETLDDFSKVEKMVCDYYNVFVCMFNLYHGFSKDFLNSYTCVSPVFIDDYNIRIIDGIKINFQVPSKFKQISGFDDKEKEVIMVKDTDYFIDKYDILYCPSKVLELKNIHKIKVVLFDDDKKNLSFKVNEHLSA